jgi:hypothetical protein
LPLSNSIPASSPAIGKDYAEYHGPVDLTEAFV